MPDPYPDVAALLAYRSIYFVLPLLLSRALLQALNVIRRRRAAGASE